MGDVIPEIELNETPLRDIDPERFGEELIGSWGELDVKIEYTPNGSTVYICGREGCNIDVTSDGEPSGPYERDVQQERCHAHPDYDDETKPAPHLVTVAPLGWLDTIRVQTDPEHDEAVITITIDRHPIIMSVARVNRTEPSDTAKLLLDVPHPDRDFQSYTLTPPVADQPATGKYIIGDRPARR
jgi:hypothetical protein